MMFDRLVFRTASPVLLSQALRLLVLVSPLLVAPHLLTAQANQPDDSASSSSSPSDQAPSNGKSKPEQGASSAQMYTQEKAPSLVDPAGDAISLVSSETLFTMAAALNACGYDEGLDESDPVRKHVRAEVDKALAASEEARTSRDSVCQYVAQHRMTGTNKDISQYISLALYLTPPPELETSVELPQMPTDSTQVVEVLPFLRAFAKAVDLHGIWVTTHRSYDEDVNRLHEPLTKMIVSTNIYLKMPASTYDGRRFLVVVEPMLSPRTINARIYGADFIVVVSPVDGKIRMNDVRHTYLHYLIEPLLYQRATAMDRFLPILKDVREAPLEFQYRTDIVALTIECLIKAVEARTMDTGIPAYVLPPDARRSDFERIEHDRNVISQKMEAVRQTRIHHEMAQGFVLTDYFYEQLTHFEKDPASLKDTIGELVYSMDVQHEDHRAKEVTFDQQADGDVLRRSAPRKLAGLDLAELRLAAGDYATASTLARKSLASPSKGPDGKPEPVDTGRANFILARAAILTGHPQEAEDGFQKAAATAKETRIAAWSHIYLGRIADLDCRRDDAVGQYHQALAVRDGQQDTRIAAERGVKTAYAVKGHACETDSDDDADPKDVKDPANFKDPAAPPPAKSPAAPTEPHIDFNAPAAPPKPAGNASPNPQ